MAEARQKSCTVMVDKEKQSGDPETFISQYRVLWSTKVHVALNLVGDVRLPVLHGVLSLNVRIPCDDATSFVYEVEIQKTDENSLAIETNKRSILRTFALFYDRTSLFTSFGPVIRRESLARNHEKRGTGKSSRFSAILWLISWLVMQFSFRLTRVWRREFYRA